MIFKGRSMGEYVFGIIGAAAVIGIMENLVPQNGKTKNYMRLVTALCLLCLVIKPLSAVAQTLPALFSDAVEELAEEEDVTRSEYEAILEGEIADTVRAELRGAITEALEMRFGVTDCEVGVSLVRTDGELRAERAVITLMGKDIFKDPYAIEDYFGGLLGCECVVVVG